MINELAQEIYENAKSKGFYEKPPSIAERIALIHSEASEALEADRKDLNFPKFSEGSTIKVVNGWIRDDDFKSSFQRDVKDTFEDELADIMIRVMDLAAHQQIDIEQHIKAKMRFNSLREYKHGKKY